ncbi:hypothetical protein IAU60_002429 [Kwoniella sp. DSM 27419]
MTSPICQDCNQPVSQPASTSHMARLPSTTSATRVTVTHFPAPTDPPATAAHKTEWTISGPPTPGAVPRPKQKEPEEQGQQGPSDPPESASTTVQSDSAETLVAPRLAEVKPSIIIEFCDRCRWAPRATWIQTELFLTFPNQLIRSITLMPLTSPETGGRFRVWVDSGDGKGDQLVWDRKTEGGFPELKVLKQRIRNIIQPDMGLGHSDVHGKPKGGPEA